jgi:magnesium and cobalt transporter
MFEKVKNLFEKKENQNVFKTLEEIIEDKTEETEQKEKDSLEAREIRMLQNLLQMRDTRAKDVMVPAVDIAGIPADIGFKEFLKILPKDKFTRYPVYEKDMDHIIGIVHIKDILYAIIEKRTPQVRELMSSAILFVAPSMKVVDLIQEMQCKQIQMAIVVDEYGGTDGVITMEDLLEEIVGEIEDEHDGNDAPYIKKIDDTTLEADAKTRLEDLNDYLPKGLYANKDTEIDTLGGLIIDMAGRIPNKTEIIEHSSGVSFKILERDARCVRKVQILHLPVMPKHED